MCTQHRVLSIGVFISSSSFFFDKIVQVIMLLVIEWEGKANVWLLVRKHNYCSVWWKINDVYFMWYQWGMYWWRLLSRPLICDFDSATSNLFVRAKDSVKHFHVTRRDNGYVFGFNEFATLQDFVNHFANQPLLGSDTGTHNSSSSLTNLLQVTSLCSVSQLLACFSWCTHYILWEICKFSGSVMS